MRKRKLRSVYAKQLRELRVEKDYSRAELSAKSGVSQTVLYKIEVLGHVPTQRTIEKLAAVLGDDVRKIFDEIQ